MSVTFIMRETLAATSFRNFDATNDAFHRGDSSVVSAAWLAYRSQWRGLYYDRVVEPFNADPLFRLVDKFKFFLTPWIFSRDLRTRNPLQPPPCIRCQVYNWATESLIVLFDSRIRNYQRYQSESGNARCRIWFEPSAGASKIEWHRYVRRALPIFSFFFFQLQMQTKFDEAKIKSVRYPAFSTQRANCMIRRLDNRYLLMAINTWIGKAGERVETFSRDLSPSCIEEKITPRIIDQYYLDYPSVHFFCLMIKII